MIVYHATKRPEDFASILATGILRPGKNVSDKNAYVHLSLDPFKPGAYALDVIGPDTNEAWILTCFIPDNTPLLPDPSGEGEIYGGTWVVHVGTLKVEVVQMTHIPDVTHWESSNG